MTQARVPVFSLGERITKAYKDLGWKQDDLAARIGVDRKTLGNWIAGRHRASYADLLAIAQVTNVAVEFFTEVADLDPRGRGQAGDSQRDDRLGDTHDSKSRRYSLSHNVIVDQQPVAQAA